MRPRSSNPTLPSTNELRNGRAGNVRSRDPGVGMTATQVQKIESVECILFSLSSYTHSQRMLQYNPPFCFTILTFQLPVGKAMVRIPVKSLYMLCLEIYEPDMGILCSKVGRISHGCSSTKLLQRISFSPSTATSVSSATTSASASSPEVGLFKRNESFGVSLRRRGLAFSI